ncbi:AAA domain-containing protein [Mycena kentingensis (nom. inval.)]|nr:AAA domain-containing protein [Mycena kentingensis (nom. inval.)]
MTAPALQILTALKSATAGISAPYLKEIVGVSVLVFETAEAVKTNKQQCESLLERLPGVLTNLLTFLNAAGDSDFVELPPPIVDECFRLLETLQKIEGYLRSQQDVGRFRRLIRQQRTASHLEECKAALASATTFFKMDSLTGLADLDAATRAQHQEMLEMLQKNSSLISFSSRSSTSGASTLSLFLPPAPQIFHGREKEIEQALEILIQESPHVVLLGPGGIGKTAMAKTLMHDSSVVAKYKQRYFIACDSMRTENDIALALAVALGVKITSRPGAAVVQQLRAQPGTLIVLDNFETPWEDEMTRGPVEKFLANLAEVPEMGLLITMRGQERPSYVKWSKPFLPPLEPLSAVDAFEAFVEIADPDDTTNNEDISKLLSITGNVPLAVILMASTASRSDGGCSAVLARWSTENIALLSEGEDKDQSLTASIRISLSSPRLKSTPGALELLSIISLMPDGLIEGDLRSGVIPIGQPLAAKIALMRTALAYHEAGRLKVLAPVREVISTLHPPAYMSLLRPLRIHWECLYRPWHEPRHGAKSDLRRLFADMGNYKSVLQYGLSSLKMQNRREIKDIIHALFILDSFYLTFGISLLSPEVEDHIERLDEDDLRMRYLIKRIHSGGTLNIEILTEPALRYAHEAQNLSAEAEIHYAVARVSNGRGKLDQALEESRLALSVTRKVPSYESSNLWQRALVVHSEISRCLGRAVEARNDADQAVWIAQQNGDFDGECKALNASATTCIQLGHFPDATEKLERVCRLLWALGVEGSQQEIAALDVLADVYLHQTAYLDARKVHHRIMEMTSAASGSRGPELFNANSLQEIIGLDVELGRYQTEDEVLTALKPAQDIFSSRKFRYAERMRDLIIGNLFQRIGRLQEAEEQYHRCLLSPHNASVALTCLNLVKMASLSLQNAPETTVRWAVVLFAYSKFKRCVQGIPWALLYFAKAHSDLDAGSRRAVLNVALEEFGRMGIYRGRAECLLELADEHSGKEQEQRAEARELLLRCGLLVSDAIIMAGPKGDSSLPRVRDYQLSAVVPSQSLIHPW